jgi:LytS/YehU family sensor histidine kinase
MRKKLFCILPNTEGCKFLISQLKNIGVSETDIRVVNNQDSSLEDLHKATQLQKTELAHGIKLGVSVGCLAGLLGGILAVIFPPSGVIPDEAAILLIITTLTGGFFGGFVSALIAAALSSHTLEDCHNAIVNGNTLLVLNVPIHHFNDRIALIKTLYPEVRLVTS